MKILERLSGQGTTMKKPEQLTEYYIAYFDILGYKEYYKENADNITSFLELIDATMNYTIGTVKRYSLMKHSKDLNLDIKIKIFSDNVLLCMKTGQNKVVERIRLLLFVVIISEIQQTLYSQCCIFIRGSITKGVLSFNDDYVFGEGLIDAVKIEESTVYPRLEVDKKLVEYLNIYHLGPYEKQISVEKQR